MAQVAEWQVLSPRGIPIVEGFVNGRKVLVMLDTGGITMIFRSATERLGLSPHYARHYRVVGVGGETDVESTTVEEFKIGSLVRTDWQVMVAGERKSPADVLLGEDVFDKVDVEFDLPHKQVRLFQPSGCENVPLAYWAPQQASPLNLGAGPKIVVPVKVNGLRVQAILDSGAAVSLLNSGVAKRLGFTSNSPGLVSSGQHAGVGPNLVNSWLARMQSFSIGGETISDTVIRFADLGLGAEMLLGADFLRAHRVLVAHSQRKMYFTYEGGPVFETRVPSSAGEPSSEEAMKAAPPEGGSTSPGKTD